jgi:hypothetical protein
VNATLDDEHPKPPVIVASSATNQAVTNIIKAVGSIADSSDEPTIGSRWLPLVQSYGWYFAARTAAEKDEFQSYQILGRGRGNTWEFSGAATDLGEHLGMQLSLRVRGSGRLVAPKGWVALFVAWIRRQIVKQQRRSLVALLAPSTGVAELPADDIGFFLSVEERNSMVGRSARRVE